jgi:hypothetical protein
MVSFYLTLVVYWVRHHDLEHVEHLMFFKTSFTMIEGSYEMDRDEHFRVLACSYNFVSGNWFNFLPSV